jgi:hypothetical protein
LTILRAPIRQNDTLAGHAFCELYCGARETVGESSVSVVAGVRTVTTNMNGRDVLPRCRAHSLCL